MSLKVDQVLLNCLWSFPLEKTLFIVFTCLKHRQLFKHNRYSLLHQQQTGSDLQKYMMLYIYRKLTKLLMRYCFETHCTVNLVHLFSSVLSQYLDICTRKRSRFSYQSVSLWGHHLTCLFWASCFPVTQHDNQNILAVNQAKAKGSVSIH